MKRPVPSTLDGDTFKPVANDVVADVSNWGSMGPIQPDVDHTDVKGVAPASHPELAASHPDVKLARIADANQPGHEDGYTTVGHDSSAIDGPIREHAPASHWDSTRLASGVDAEK